MELDLHPGQLVQEFLLLTTGLLTPTAKLLCELLQYGFIPSTFSPPPSSFDLSANPVSLTFRIYPESDLSSPHPLPSLLGLLQWPPHYTSALDPSSFLTAAREGPVTNQVNPKASSAQTPAVTPAPSGKKPKSSPWPSSPDRTRSLSPLRLHLLAPAPRLSAPAELTLLFLTYTKQAPTSGPLYLLAFPSACNFPSPEARLTDLASNEPLFQSKLFATYIDSRSKNSHRCQLMSLV